MCMVHAIQFTVLVSNASYTSTEILQLKISHATVLLLYSLQVKEQGTGLKGEIYLILIEISAQLLTGSYAY